MTAPLAGRCVVVTRPAHQAGPLAASIEAAGGHPILFPVIDILDVENDDPVNALIDRLDQFDLAIFISPNAVQKGLAMVQRRRSLPGRLRYAAVGQGSARTLHAAGIADVTTPREHFDSEALLALPPLLDVAGQHIVIFRGNGGRDLLGDTLASRGAVVEYAPCYRRARPAGDASVLFEAWRRGALDALTASSSEGLRNLFAMLGDAGQPLLHATPLFASHARIGALARELGVVDVHVTAAGDDGLFNALVDFFSGRVHSND